MEKTETRCCHIPVVEYQQEEKDIKNFPPGGHHNGSMQTTEKMAEANQKRMIYAKFPPDYK
jgi:hypothetical protein